MDIPLSVANFTGSLIEQTINPFLTHDMLGMKDLNVDCASMDKVAFDYLHRFRLGGHFTKVEGYYGKKVEAAVKGR